MWRQWRGWEWGWWSKGTLSKEPTTEIIDTTVATTPITTTSVSLTVSYSFNNSPTNHSNRTWWRTRPPDGPEPYVSMKTRKDGPKKMRWTQHGHSKWEAHRRDHRPPSPRPPSPRPPPPQSQPAPIVSYSFSFSPITIVTVTFRPIVIPMGDNF